MARGLLLAATAAALTLPPLVRIASWRDAPPGPVDVSSAEAGKALFLHEFTENDPLCPEGDGLGPVFNAKSCVACHHQGGAGGSGPLNRNVTTFLISRGAIRRSPVRGTQREGVDRAGLVHHFATKPEYRETVQQVHPGIPTATEHPQTFPVSSRHDFGAVPTGISISERKTPALFGANLINAIPDREIIAMQRAQELKRGMVRPGDPLIPVGRALRLPSGRIGHFGWKAQMATLDEFVQAACANELGLGNPAQAQPKPLGAPDYSAPGLDLTLEQCSQITAFIESLPRPIERLPEISSEKESCEEGRGHFTRIGCADCHAPTVGSVDGIYSDLLLHDMGDDSSGGGSYGHRPPEVPDVEDQAPRPSEWRTPPLWGVADAAPYLHDGRASTLREAIEQHGGQGQAAKLRFQGLSETEKRELGDFLRSLRAPDPVK